MCACCIANVFVFMCMFMMFAILVANMFVPLIERMLKDMKARKTQKKVTA